MPASQACAVVNAVGTLAATTRSSVSRAESGLVGPVSWVGSLVDVGDAVVIQVRARSEASLDRGRAVGAPLLQVSADGPVVHPGI